MIDPTFNNNSFENGDNDPTRNSFFDYYVPLVEIKDFNVLIEKKTFFINPQKANNKRTKNVSNCQEMMTIQQETY